MYLVLTQGAWCTRITNVSIRTCANWLMHNNSAVCVSCTWVPFSTRVNALPIFTCGIIRAISVTSTTNKHIRWLHYIYKVFSWCQNRSKSKVQKSTYLCHIESKGLLGSQVSIHILHYVLEQYIVHFCRKISIYMLVCRSLIGIFRYNHILNLHYIQEQQ